MSFITADARLMAMDATLTMQPARH